jgi:hypothetical protein
VPKDVKYRPLARHAATPLRDESQLSSFFVPLKSLVGGTFSSFLCYPMGYPISVFQKKTTNFMTMPLFDVFNARF